MQLTKFAFTILAFLVAFILLCEANKQAEFCNRRCLTIVNDVIAATGKLKQQGGTGYLLWNEFGSKVQRFCRNIKVDANKVTTVDFSHCNKMFSTPILNQCHPFMGSQHRVTGQCLKMPDHLGSTKPEIRVTFLHSSQPLPALSKHNIYDTSMKNPVKLNCCVILYYEKIIYVKIKKFHSFHLHLVHISFTSCYKNFTWVNKSRILCKLHSFFL